MPHWSRGGPHRVGNGWFLTSVPSGPADGPAQSAEFAARAGIDARYAREWLSAMTAHGYVHYDPVTGSFSLPVAHVSPNPMARLGVPV